MNIKCFKDSVFAYFLQTWIGSFLSRNIMPSRTCKVETNISWGYKFPLLKKAGS